MQKVDVAISYYGKPYQTMITLFSLLEKSGDYVDKIYLSIEKKQPYEDAWEGIVRIEEIFGPKGLVIVHPDQFLPWMSDQDASALDEPARLSIRYQYALEKTDKRYLLISHNDMLYQTDMIGPMLALFAEGDEKLVGVGQIGQCWNCAAFHEKVCYPDKFEDYRPDKAELLALMDRWKMPRDERNRRTVEAGFVHPLPECRLNEYACLIQVPLYRATTLPNGPVPYFGGVWNGADTAVAWFRDSYLNGLKFKNIYFDQYAVHAPFSAVSNGNDADNNRRLYEDIERQAKEYMIAHYHPDRYSLGTTFRAASQRNWRKLKNLMRKTKAALR